MIAGGGASRVQHSFRYVLAAIGPIGSAGAQFVLSLILIGRTSPENFGKFAFLQVIGLLALLVVSHLVSDPMAALVARGEHRRDRLGEALVAVTGLFVIGATLAFAICAAWLGLTIDAIVAFTISALLTLVRGVGRAHAYAFGHPFRSMTSDLIYSASLTVGCAILFLSGAVSLALTFVIVGVSAAISIVPFLPAIRTRLANPIRFRDLRSYHRLWRSQTRWSLVNGLSTEVMFNAPSYLVTIILGPAAFAPVAAASLVIRPISVAMNALGEAERPQMARALATGDVKQAFKLVRLFRFALIGIWTITAIGTAGLLLLAPRLVFPASYDLRIISLCAALWLFVGIARMLSRPEGILLQAAGNFQTTTVSRVAAAVIAVSGVLLFAFLGLPEWSIASVLVAEAFAASGVFAGARKFRRDIAQPSAHGQGRLM